MSARIVILDLLEPAGTGGLSIATQAAYEAGADEVFPIATGLDSGDEGLALAPARAVEQTLEAALRYPVQALLIGRLGNSEIAAAVTQALASDLPETIIFAPGPYVPPRSWFAGSAARRQRQHFRTLVRESTVVMMTAAQVSEWFEAGELDASAAGERLCAEGAFGAWIRDRRGSVRTLDRLISGDANAVLDYPAIDEDAPDRVPGALAALLGRGLTLEDAMAESQRHAACPRLSESVACR
jgi:hypothetical protein